MDFGRRVRCPAIFSYQWKELTPTRGHDDNPRVTTSSLTLSKFKVFAYLRIIHNIMCRMSSARLYGSQRRRSAIVPIEFSKKNRPPSPRAMYDPAPELPSESDCCGTGCADCVFDVYDRECARWHRRRRRNGEGGDHRLRRDLLSVTKHKPFRIVSAQPLGDDVYAYTFAATPTSDCPSTTLSTYTSGWRTASADRTRPWPWERTIARSTSWSRPTPVDGSPVGCWK